MSGYTDLSTKPYGTQQNIHVPAVTSSHPYITMTRHVIQGCTNAIAMQGNVTFDNTTEIEGTSVSTAIVKKDEPAIGTVHIIIMASAGLLGLAFTACLIVKLFKYRRLQNLQDRTANVLQQQNTVPFHNPVYGYASDSTDAQSGPASAMDLEIISMPNLAWTPDRHRTARRRTPGLKRSTNPSLQVAGLQARATTPS
ncbi:Hypp280 [Branchiostoma lanceolatum]|uniref:Hypp280 protein n=1 Tax=Branchiostoma lanceolatum TaxID=7740 RepID=A0A8J9YIL9_BRALA|nr:Hypp280 [Branchiostoma lanceolatum]